MRGLIAASIILAAAATAPGAAQAGILGCDARGGKQEGGAAIGAVIGGLIGSRVAEDNRGLGAIVGAGLGAAVGSSIGCKMQEEDQRRAEAAIEEALRTGRPASWRNPNSGAHGEIRVLPAGTRGAGYGEPIRLGDNVDFAPGVQPQSRWAGGGGWWYSPGAVNLRARPSTRAAVVGRLAGGRNFQALAKVPGQAWLLVGRDGEAVGYVAESVVRPAGAEPGCRAIEQTIYSRQTGSESERFRACRKSGGGWELAPI